jgi:hypothetical protein
MNPEPWNSMPQNRERSEAKQGSAFPVTESPLIRFPEISPSAECPKSYLDLCGSGGAGHSDPLQVRNHTRLCADLGVQGQYGTVFSSPGAYEADE